MIDIHSHLLPGVDDGSRSLEQSVGVLTRFARDGVELVVCTPHLNATEAQRVDHARYRTVFEELLASAPAELGLRMGWEIMLDAPAMDLTSPDLHLARSTAILVEFPRTNVPHAATYELERLRSSGLVPVLAHPERYWGCTAEQVAEWRRAGAVIQMDAAMLLGQGAPSRLARALLESGLVDCIASDNHGDTRSVAAARQWLVEIGAAEQAELLTRVNAAHLLADEPIVPVAPVMRVERGMVGRLRELLFGRR